MGCHKKKKDCLQKRKEKTKWNLQSAIPVEPGRHYRPNFAGKENAPISTGVSV